MVGGTSGTQIGFQGAFLWHSAPGSWISTSFVVGQEPIHGGEPIGSMVSGCSYGLKYLL